MLAICTLTFVSACSDTQSGGGSAAGSAPAALTAKDLQLASLSRLDLPSTYELRGEGRALEWAREPAKADVPDCQPMADIFSTSPQVARRARTGQEMYDFGGGRADWYHVYLDAYGSEKEAHEVLETLRSAVDKCSRFNIVGDWELGLVSKVLAPAVKDESMAFRCGRWAFTVARTGTVLAVFVEQDTSERGAPGEVSPTLVKAQLSKLREAIAQR
ncbi:hypothetical protein ACFYNY_19715 [Streptomyces sp. NPDC006530]|uniref:hypothetical protein n=1 Tax=Streptomyces sp. NPDC006530 TaxID=3364750 RepID=UPI0036C75287